MKNRADRVQTKRGQSCCVLMLAYSDTECCRIGFDRYGLSMFLMTTDFADEGGTLNNMLVKVCLCGCGLEMVF